MNSTHVGVPAQATYRLQVGEAVFGVCLPVADPHTEPVEYYRVSRLRVIERARGHPPELPPWLGVPPPLPKYRERGHRRLDARAYAAKCTASIWGCRMPVEIILDQWKPDRRRYRFETLCYEPKSCPLYRAVSTCGPVAPGCQRQ
jgi:hypothetical protein